MKRIWAPWRKAYIRPEHCVSKGCLFCRLLTAKHDKQNYILKRTSFSFAVLNKYPYNNGHVMIVPNRHVATLESLTDQEKLDWLSLYSEIQKILKRALKAHGFNVGINVGGIAGAGVPKHLHLHVVPRWRGDVNFMPVIAGTKVISESLDSVYKVLAHQIKSSRHPKGSR